jgi:hypothetical protein
LDNQLSQDNLISGQINGLPMTNFTPEDLLLYLYNETSAEQKKAIESALKSDWTLREKLEVLKASMQRLDKITVSPRTEVVLNVLNYAKEKSVEVV